MTAAQVYEEMLRADKAELALKDAQRRLALVLSMADSWQESWGGGTIRTDVAAGAIRRAIRGLEYAP